MDFNLTDTQKELQKKAQEFAIKEILPVAASYDEHGKFPIEIIEKAYKAGLVNLAIPKKYGGPGYGLLESVVVVEEIAAACPGFATSIFATNLGAEPLLPLNLEWVLMLLELIVELKKMEKIIF